VFQRLRPQVNCNRYTQDQRCIRLQETSRVLVQLGSIWTWPLRLIFSHTPIRRGMRSGVFLQGRTQTDLLRGCANDMASKGTPFISSKFSWRTMICLTCGKSCKSDHIPPISGRMKSFSSPQGVLTRYGIHTRTRRLFICLVPGQQQSRLHQNCKWLPLPRPPWALFTAH